MLAKEMNILDFGASKSLLRRHLCKHVKRITALDRSNEMLLQLQGNTFSWKQ
jgi:cyclopropane fatty-acyl-phospholipid synthase-like methyltransferase